MLVSLHAHCLLPSVPLRQRLHRKGPNCRWHQLMTTANVCAYTGPRLVLLPQHAALQSRRQSGLTTSTSGTSQSSRGNSQRAVSLPANRDPIAYQSWAADDEPIAAPTTRVPGAPQRICIFVEPSPFTYVSGYRNRFTSMIKYLVEVGCDVLVVTTGGHMSQSL